jgi:uncharacterized protein YdhG (YjbR/CyaY superfamily)
MRSDSGGSKAIDEYIAGFPEKTRAILRKVRAAIRAAAPDAEEKISYGMPTFAQNGNLVHFAAYERHIGFYPAPSGIEAFQEELAQYKGAKGSVQFPIGEAMPLDLIARITKYRLEENERIFLEKKKPRAEKRSRE